MSPHLLPNVLLLAATRIELHNAGLVVSLRAAMRDAGVDDPLFFADAVIAARDAGFDPDHDHVRRAASLRTAANELTATTAA